MGLTARPSGTILTFMVSPVAQRAADIVRGELRKRGISDAALGRHLYPDRSPGSRAMAMHRRFNGVTPFTLDELDRVGDFLGVPIELLIDAAA